MTFKLRYRVIKKEPGIYIRDIETVKVISVNIATQCGVIGSHRKNGFFFF